MHLNKICPVCHQSFEARRKDQVYCTYYCRKKHHKETYYSKNRIVEDFNDEDTHVILRQFRCKKCHELVTVVNKHDRRSIFCSPRCEKLYWKHPIFICFFLFFMYNKGNRYYLLRKRVDYGTNWEKRLY